jgi:hypothetical protein
VRDVPAIWGLLGFVGAAVVGMLLSEVHESASIVARFLVERAADRLPLGVREVRRDEWLAKLDAMEGLHILRLCRALGYTGSTFLVGQAVRRLPPKMREVRREEWLAELDAMKGPRIPRLCRALGYCFASVRLRERRKRHMRRGAWWRADPVDAHVVAETIDVKTIAPGPAIAMEGTSTLGVTARLEADGQVGFVDPTHRDDDLQ